MNNPQLNWKILFIWGLMVLKSRISSIRCRRRDRLVFCGDPSVASNRCTVYRCSPRVFTIRSKLPRKRHVFFPWGGGELLMPLFFFSDVSWELEVNSLQVQTIVPPFQENIEKPLPCFKGYSPRSFLSLLALRFDTGYPVGELSTRVEDPYVDVKAHAVDATCAFAFGIQYLLRQGHSVEQIQRRDPEVYRKFSEYLRTELDFEGTSGQVKFEGNDRKNLQVVQQVVNGVILDMGLISENGTSITWISNGTTNLYWQDEPAEALELMWILHPLAMIFAIGCPCLCGCVLGYSIRAVMQKRSNAQ